MTPQRLPAGLAPKGSSPTFTEESVPDALQQTHALAAGHWGVLQLLAGDVCFVDLGTGEQKQLTAPELVVIAPEAPHRLSLTGPLRCRIDFFREIHGDPTTRTRDLASHDAVRQSLARCETAGNFGERFYEIFLQAPEIAPYFASTDLDKQRQVLRDSVHIMVALDVTDPRMRETLEELGHSHSRSERNIPPRLYEIWLDKLCETVRQMDPESTDELEKLWRLRLRDAIQVITAAY